MAYTSWGSASWSTSSADGLCVGGNHVASVVASVVVPNRSSLCMRVRAVAVAVAGLAGLVGAASGAALTVAVVASVEVDVGMAEGAEEGSETEVASEVVGVAAASEVGMSMDHREVAAAIGSCFAERYHSDPDLLTPLIFSLQGQRWRFGLPRWWIQRRSASRQVRRTFWTWWWARWSRWVWSSWWGSRLWSPRWWSRWLWR